MKRTSWSRGLSVTDDLGVVPSGRGGRRALLPIGRADRGSSAALPVPDSTRCTIGSGCGWMWRPCQGRRALGKVVMR